MINPPKTREEAEQRWLGICGSFDPDKCAHGAGENYYFFPHQCTRKPGKGPGKLYCKQHAKMVEGK